MMAHSTKGLGEILLQFARLNFTQEQAVFEELLKLDLLLLVKGAVRIAGLNWDSEQWGENKTGFWRNEALLRQYFPEYKPLSWRELKKRYLMEEMRIDVAEYLANGNILQKKQMIIIENDGEFVKVHVLPEN